MCGIAGEVALGRAYIDVERVRRMCEVLHHRGPDDGGVRGFDSAVLGQRRLSIIDLAPAACAPLSNEDGTIWIVFNGEIYNYQELRATLEASGHCFRTRSDTETIIHAYEEYGDECVDRLRGMFAFAIWDQRNRRLFCARDRLGKKPFHYCVVGTSLIFASEIKALLCHPSVPREVDDAALGAFLKRQYIPGPRTAWRQIRKLGAGQSLSFDRNGNLLIKDYWRPPTTLGFDQSMPREEAVKLVREQLRVAVVARLVADVPIGALLSAGIDSAAVVATMAGATTSAVKTYTVNFQSTSHTSEAEGARRIASHFGTEHHEIEVGDPGVDVIARVVDMFDEPFGDSSAIPSYYVCRFAAGQVKVVLTGDGGDETFAGYESYRRALRWQQIDAIPLPMRRVLASLVKGAAAPLIGTDTRRNASTLADFLGANCDERFIMQTAIYKPAELAWLLTPEFAERVARSNAESISMRVAGETLCDWMMRYDRSTYLPDCLNAKVDRTSMANSLEVRCPLLDHELVQSLSRIPWNQKTDGKLGKIIFRDAMAGILPDDILCRPKSGFGAPLAEWIRRPLRQPIRELLLDGNLSRRGLIRDDSVRRMVEQHWSGARDWSSRLWLLAVMEQWFRKHVGV